MICDNKLTVGYFENLFYVNNSGNMEYKHSTMETRRVLKKHKYKKTNIHNNKRIFSLGVHSKNL